MLNSSYYYYIVRKWWCFSIFYLFIDYVDYKTCKNLKATFIYITKGLYCKHLTKKSKYTSFQTTNTIHIHSHAFQKKNTKHVYIENSQTPIHYEVNSLSLNMRCLHWKHHKFPSIIKSIVYPSTWDSTSSK